MSSSDYTVGSGPFQVDFSFLDRGEKIEVPPLEESNIKKRELSRYFYSKKINLWVDNIQDSSLTTIKFLEVASKVTLIFRAIVSILIPLGMYYLPLWAPLGIGLPVLLILSFVIAPKLEKSISDLKRDNIYVPMAKGFVNSRSFKRYHPVGPWDLPARDRRLKSDNPTRFDKPKEKAADATELEEAFGFKSREGANEAKNSYGDPEEGVTTVGDAACQFARVKEVPEKWNKIKALSKDAYREAQRHKHREYRKKTKERLETAYLKESFELQLGPWQTVKLADFKPSDIAISPGGKVLAVLRMYGSFCRLFKEAKALYKESRKQWAPFVFLPKAQRDPPQWERFVEKVAVIELQMRPIEALMKEESPSHTDVLRCLLSIKESDLELSLVFLIQETKKQKLMLQERSKQLPRNKLASIKKDLDERRKKILSQEQLIKLDEWIRDHKLQAEKKIVELPKSCFDKEFAKDFFAWLKNNPEMESATPLEIFNRSVNLHEAYLKVEKGFKKLSDNLEVLETCQEQTLALQGSPEEDPAYLEAIANFKSQYHCLMEGITYFENRFFTPFKVLIRNRGETSRAARWAEAFFYKSPTVPFFKEKLPESLPLRTRKKIERCHNQELESIDFKIVWANRIHTGALRVPIILLIALEGIFAIYFSSPWLFWGFCVATTVGEGISYYINQRLKQMEAEKEALKLERTYQDRPDIGQIPGTAPKLERVKKLQQELNLDNVSKRWAQATRLGDKTIPDPKDCAEAKEMILKLAKEGREQTRLYFEKRLTMLTDRLNRVQGRLGRLEVRKRRFKKNEYKALKRQFTERAEFLRGRIAYIQGVLTVKEPTPKELELELVNFAKNGNRFAQEQLTRQYYTLDREIKELPPKANKSRQDLIERRDKIREALVSKNKTADQLYEEAIRAWRAKEQEWDKVGDGLFDLERRKEALAWILRRYCHLRERKEREVVAHNREVDIAKEVSEVIVQAAASPADELVDPQLSTRTILFELDQLVRARRCGRLPEEGEDALGSFTATLSAYPLEVLQECLKRLEKKTNKKLNRMKRRTERALLMIEFEARQLGITLSRLDETEIKNLLENLKKINEEIKDKKREALALSEDENPREIDEAIKEKKQEALALKNAFCEESLEKINEQIAARAANALKLKQECELLSQAAQQIRPKASDDFNQEKKVFPLPAFSDAQDSLRELLSRYQEGLDPDLGAIARHDYESRWLENNLKYLREFYYDLNVAERKALWWELPQSFRDELSGAKLLAYCYQPVYQRDEDPDSKSSPKIIGYANPNAETIEADSVQIKDWFRLIAPERQREVFHSLPSLVKEHLRKYYKAVSGKGVLDRIIILSNTAIKGPSEEAVKDWALVISSFCLLDPYYQERLYSALSERVGAQFNHYLLEFFFKHLSEQDQSDIYRRLPSLLQTLILKKYEEWVAVREKNA